MQPAQQPLNSWLLNYITQHRDTKSRYDIDHYLIHEGYNPQEIEAVWQHLAPKAVEQRSLSKNLWLQSLKFWRVIKFILKGLCTLEWLAVFGSLVFLWLGFNALSWWPFIFSHFVLGLILAAVSGLCTIGLLIWHDRKKVVKLNRIVSGGAICLLIFATLAFASIAVFDGSNNYTELANTSVDSHDYHLVYHHNCIDLCSEALTLYRCDFFNQICPSIAGVELTYRDSLSALLPNPSEPTRLEFDPATRYINVVNSGKIVYTFVSQ